MFSQRLGSGANRGNGLGARIPESIPRQGEGQSQGSRHSPATGSRTRLGPTTSSSDARPGGRRQGAWRLASELGEPYPLGSFCARGEGVVLAHPAHPVSPTGAQADGGFIPGAQGACLQSPAGLCLWSVCGAAPNSGLKPETWTGQGRGCRQTLRVPATPRPQYSWRWGLWLIPRPTWANAEDPNEDPLVGDSVPCPQPCPGSHTFLCGPDGALNPRWLRDPLSPQAFLALLLTPLPLSPPPKPCPQLTHFLRSLPNISQCWTEL